MICKLLTISEASESIGYSQGEIKTYIRDGIWKEGFVWIATIGGEILIDIQGFEAWATGSPPIQIGFLQ